MGQPTVTILDVGARDGLQNEDVAFSIADKLALITRIATAGVKRIEVASFVHPKLVPQMADAEDVVAALADDPHIQYIGLALNKRGYLRALATRDGGKRGIDQVGCVLVASDTFGQKNQGQSVSEAQEVCSEILRLGKRDGLSAQVTISSAFGCPFEGEIAQDDVIDLAKRLSDDEPDEITIADTIGVAVPSQVTDMMGRMRDELPGMPLRVHFHDTRNTGVANSWAAHKAGVETIDASVAGLGGCPFAPRATGNVATEDVVYMFERSGVHTGVDLDVLIETAEWLQGILGRPTPAMVSQAGKFPKGASVHA